MPDPLENNNEDGHFFCFSKAFSKQRSSRFGEKESEQYLLSPSLEGDCDWSSLNKGRKEMRDFFSKNFYNISKRDENSRKVFIVFQESINTVISRILESNSGALDSLIILVLPHNNRLNSAGSNFNSLRSQEGNENLTKSQLIVDTYLNLSKEFSNLFNLIN